MTGVRLWVENRRFLVGCSAGLNERTAVVEVGVDGAIDADTAADATFRAGTLGLCPEEPLFGVAESDWPDVFVMGPRGRGVAELEWLGRWVVALTVAIQRWGRDPVWQGRVLQADSDRLLLAIPWRRDAFCTDALNLALELVQRWLESEAVADSVRGLSGTGPIIAPTVKLSEHFAGSWPSIQSNGLSPYTMRFIQAGVARNMPVDVLPSFVQLGWGINTERFDMSFTKYTGWIATVLAKNKIKTSRTLAGEFIPVPAFFIVAAADQAEEAADQLGWPVVIKPSNQDQGLGVVAGIRDRETLRRAFEAAASLSPGNVIVEKHIDGDDHRLLVVRGRMLSAARRSAAAVVGDGTCSITQLVELVNADPRRGTGNFSQLKKIVLDDAALECLAEQGLNVDSVPAVGRSVWLRRIANVSAGGTAADVTAVVHPDNRALAERAARVVGLDIAGIDFLCPDISRSWREVGGAICEVNAQPSQGVHWLAEPGRDLEGEILDILFDGRSSRIPTAAITGTNGKTTTAMMLHHIWAVAGKLTGVCTTSTLRIGDEIVSTANLSGQPGARAILNDPAVQAGVFEMPRKGLIYFGHPCDHYDVAALLNVTDDHLGIDGIDTLEQMAELKAEVLERASGAIVVNADDQLCLAMRSRAGAGRHILVARDPANFAVGEHRAHGGEAVFLALREGARSIVLATGGNENVVMPVHEIPATVDGLLRFNETNAMFAAALAWAQGIDIAVIRRALATFTNSAEQNPGRCNFIEGLPFRVLLDYAHNPDGAGEICSIASGLPVSGRRIVCILTIGNRHPGHAVAAAPVLAETFDEIVLGCDPQRVHDCAEYAGDDPTATMLSATRQLLLDAGVAPDRIATEADPSTAIARTLHMAAPGDLVVVLAEPGEALPVIAEFLRTR